MITQITHNNVYTIDCLEGIKLMKKQKLMVDVIVTSPPYNIGKKYNNHNDDMLMEEYLDWLEEVAKKCKEIMNDNASFFLNVGGIPTNQWIPFDLAQRFKKHFKLQNIIHWIKSIAIPKEDVGNYPNIKGDISVGHYKPVNSDRYLSNCHEFIFQFTKNGNVKTDKFSNGAPYQDKSNISRWKSANGDKRDRGNTWFIPYKTIQNSRPHPAVFPVKLPEMCLKHHGINKIKLALDPFMGIGSTAIACKKHGINFIGFEIDPTYVEIAKERLAQTNPASGVKK